MILTVALGVTCFGMLLSVIALEGQLSARTQARVGFRLGWSGFWSEPLTLFRMMLQRNQTLPTAGKAWLILWVSAASAMLGLFPWSGDGDFILLGLPVLAAVSALSLHFMSTGHLTQSIGSLVPLVLSILAVGFDAGGYSWAAISRGETLPFSIRALSRPSMALASMLFWVSAQSSFGLSPLAWAKFETEYRRGTGGAIVRLGRAGTRLALAGLTVHLFFGGGNLVWVGLKSGALVLATHLFVASLPRIRSDQWMRVGWKVLFGVGILSVFLRGFDL